MGVGNTQQSTGLSIIGDKICQRVIKGTENSVSRINKKGVEVWELQWNFVEGKIERVDTKDGDYGKQWEITLWDGVKHWTLRLPYSSRTAKAFLCCLPNVDLSKPVRIQSAIKDDKQSLFVSQDGSALKWAFTKAEPNGLPKMEKIKVKGNEVWDDSEQLAFLEKMVTERFARVTKAPTLTEEEINSLPF